MDDLERAYYDVVFERDFLKKRGTEFQNLFCNIMEHRYPSDFKRVRPWGKMGDQKSDGYLPSKRMLFQVYAPNELKDAETLKKIDEDFDGAKKHWGENFDTWVFTHNSIDGLSPRVVKKLSTLGLRQPPSVIHWGYAEIWAEFKQLNDDSLKAIFGYAPTRVTMLRGVTYSNLQAILSHIEREPYNLASPIKTVPSNKLNYNNLSGAVQLLLSTGMQRSDRVEQLFREHHDPTYGDQLAQTFQSWYKELKTQRLGPDEIFSELLIRAGGNNRGSSEHEAALLTVVAYFFEKCDIFERPD